MTVWWGKHALTEEGLVLKQIGPLLLGVQNVQDEWRFYVNRVENRVEQGGVIGEPEENLLNDDFLTQRFVVKNARPVVSLTPVLADRPFVVHAQTPFYVPPKESAVIFVVTPVWVKISVGEPPVELTELPVIRPSDTWFGSDTTKGELCYANLTKARLTVEELPKRSHMAVTPVEICNEVGSHLLLETINLPVTCLEIYEVAGKYLWTQGVRLVRKEKNEAALVEISQGSPKQAVSALYLSGPRNSPEGDNFISTISKSLFL